MPLPTRGIEDFFFNQGVLGILCLVLTAALIFLFRENRTCTRERLVESQKYAEKYLELTEKVTRSQDQMALVIEKRNETTQALATSLKDFSISFEHKTEMDKLFLQQAMEKLGRALTMLELEAKVVASIMDTVRALTPPHPRKLLGTKES